MTLSAVELGFAVGAIPTACMILVSLLLYQIHVSDLVEAAFQNFAAGLILAAVAAELFPLVAQANDTEAFVGVSVGFAVGYLFLVGTEPLSEYLVNNYKNIVRKVKVMLSMSPDIDDDDVKSPVMSPLHDIAERKKTRPKSFDGQDLPESAELMTSDIVWDDEGVSFASTAIEQTTHKEHIKHHLLEISDEITLMQDKSIKMMDESISEKDSEVIAEEIDEAIHGLQYKVDHCRRLLQGSESNVSVANHMKKKTWLNDEKKLNIKKRITALRYTSDHLLEHLNEAYIDQFLIKEIYEHMAEMDVHIHHFHDSVDVMDKIWRRSRPLVDPAVGDTLPVSLIIPVTLDCFVDGFLIGLSLGLNPKAGIILAMANCLEMSFLGMAYSARIAKCTGSTSFHRMLAILCPPLIMFLAAGIGAWLANITVAHPTVYVAFISFGIIVLLSLVCGELLIEAREAQKDDEKWYVSILVFVGIYLVLMIDRVL